MLKTIVTHKRLILYVIVGGINSGVDFLVFKLLYTFSPLAGAVIQVISYLSGVGCSFVLNRTLTFRDGAEKSISRQAPRFLLVNGISLGISVLAIHLLLQTGISATIAKAGTTVLTALINYFGYKIFVFDVKEEKVK